MEELLEPLTQPRVDILQKVSNATTASNIKSGLGREG